MRNSQICLAGAGFIVLALTALWASGKISLPETFDAQEPTKRGQTPAGPPPEGSQCATFGAGCFWCTEAVFQQLNGVHSVVSGYSGGFVKNPSYRQVCGGATGHAEVIQITYDSKVISFDGLLEVFWKTHNPTTLNQQGADRGTQYRSAIFYHTPAQKDVAEQYKKKLDASGAFKGPIVTEITAFSEFYPAETEHQNYYLDNPRKGYCSMVIRPKLDKFEKVFKNKLRPAADQ